MEGDGRRVMKTESIRLKVEDRYVQSRVYTDTFVGGCYSLDMEENVGAAAPVERYLSEYRNQPRENRQTEKQRRFWASFSEWFD